MGETRPNKLSRTHDRRLRQMYRSAGWPCLDTVEIELLAAGLLERRLEPSGKEYLRVTEAGIAHLARTLDSNRAAFDAHESLVQRVAEEMQRQGRVAYRGLSLRAKPGESWLQLRPDVYSIRNTTVEDYVEPVVHEIKVRRADLLSDLKKPDKRAGYLALSAECYYVLQAGIAEPAEIPPECGVLIAGESRIEVARLAPKRPLKLGFATWMALAKAEPSRAPPEPEPGL
ncbi:MAG: hypothetical protein EPN60_14490 [Nevskiaceae bacterium]|nr:MAG: hypothetical protein EPO48_07520 [Nevskiaceae bacterium]TAM23835.1 MAG: hypothetical protein EPN60_14490 [Nevskiaceae bacterium]